MLRSFARPLWLNKAESDSQKDKPKWNFKRKFSIGTLASSIRAGADKRPRLQVSDPVLSHDFDPPCDLIPLELVNRHRLQFPQHAPESRPRSPHYPHLLTSPPSLGSTPPSLGSTPPSLVGSDSSSSGPTDSPPCSLFQRESLDSVREESEPSSAASDSSPSQEAEAMDTSLLQPPNAGTKTRAVHQAKEMEALVAERAKRRGEEPPRYEFLELIGKGSYGRVFKG